jgi:dissimilatory sulfite reductase related protein
METLIANRPVELNEQGYLLNMEQWDKEIAKGIATEEDIELTERHFEILSYLRDEQEKGTALSIRRVGKSGVVDIKEFYQLFPGGPLKKASRIAGIPKPASCI